MTREPGFHRLDRRIHRSKRSGKLIVLSVFLVSLLLGGVLVQGLKLARDAGRTELVVPGLIGIGILAALNLFSGFLVRRQHRLLDEAREDLRRMVAEEG
jgi:hypothetical protein